MKHYVRLTILGFMVFGCMLVIFLLSDQDAENSQALSDGILFEIINFFGVGAEHAEQFGLLIRKMAHFAEYFFLGASLYLFFRELFWQKSRSNPGQYTIAAGTLYAISDEIHQFFVPGRSMQLSDIILDVSGLCTAIVLLFIFIRIIRHREELR